MRGFALRAPDPSGRRWNEGWPALERRRAGRWDDEGRVALERRRAGHLCPALRDETDVSLAWTYQLPPTHPPPLPEQVRLTVPLELVRVNESGEEPEPWAVATSV